MVKLARAGARNSANGSLYFPSIRHTAVDVTERAPVVAVYVPWRPRKGSFSAESHQRYDPA